MFYLMDRLGMLPAQLFTAGWRVMFVCDSGWK